MGLLFISHPLRRQFARAGAFLSFGLPVVFIVATMLAVSTSAVGQSVVRPEDCDAPQNSLVTLTPSETITRNLKGNERHAFRLTLSLRQYVHIVAEQKGVDVVVRLCDPSRKLLAKNDSPNGKFGPESVSTIAEASGSYFLEVFTENTQPAGSYELTVEGPRAAAPADATRGAAQRSLFEARQMASQATADSRNAAISQFKETAGIWREIGDARAEGYTLSNLGETYHTLGDFTEAMASLNQALARLSDAQDISGQAYVLNEMGAVQRDLGDPLQALDVYDRALKLRRTIGYWWGEAQLLNNIGFLYSQIGQQPKAIANSELALPIWREVGDRIREMNTLNNIAKIHLDQGNLTAAFGEFQEVLQFCGETSGVCTLEPFVRNSLGVIYEIWAEPQAAFTQYDLALQVFRATKNKQGIVSGNLELEAIVLDNIGMVYAGLGDAQGALNRFQDALKIRLELNNPGGESVTRSNIGYAQWLLGNHPEALGQLELAQRLSRKSLKQSFEAYTLVRLGLVHVSLGQTAKALECYNQALEIQKSIEDVRGEAITLDKIGEVAGLLGQPERALEAYRQAQERWIAIHDPQGQALSLFGIARLQRDQGQLTEARDRIAKAIEMVESLRTKMTSHRLRMTYFAARQDYYELEIDIRMRLYESTRSQEEMESALFASERARARNLLDLLTETHADLQQGVDPQLLNRERSLRDKLANQLKQLQLLVTNKSADQQKAAAEKELDALGDDYDLIQDEIRRRSPKYASLTQPQPLKREEIQALLDDDTVLLEYALGEKRSYLWAITRTGIFAYSLPDKSKIEKMVENFRELLTAHEPPRVGEDSLQYIARRTKAAANYQQRALDLSNTVVGPVSSRIENKRLVIVADGALQFVPFAALPAPGKGGVRRRAYDLARSPLIAKHEVVYEPSASALALIRGVPREPLPKSVAVLADPVFDKADDRVRNAQKESTTDAASRLSSSELKRALRDAGDVASSDGSVRLERLRYSRGEANAIVAAAPPGSSMEAVDFKASRATALSPELKEFRIVHFATHGLLNGNDPELSGLVLSLVNERGQPEDGFLRLGDIYNLDLPVDLVVLSACRTGIGKQVKGEGLIGLTRGFMHAGAARVVASLWKVDDEATAELMKRFYGYLLGSKVPPAAALRQAQLDIMGRSQWQAPYYWAGFVLQGEWK